MSTYKLLLKTIDAENKAFEEGNVTEEDYATWKDGTLKKMDTFLVCGRISDNQYKELNALLK
jgi:hypothetical protein